MLEDALGYDEVLGREDGVEDEGGEGRVEGDLDLEGAGGTAPGEPGLELAVADAVEGRVEQRSLGGA